MSRFPQQRRQIPDKRLKAKDARTHLVMLLVNAKDVHQFTAEQLARNYNVPLKECEQRLADAKAKRELLL